MKNNFNYYEEFNDLLNGGNTNFYEYSYSEKIGKNDEKSREAFIKAFKSRGENLIVAPTGSGKTYSFMMNNDENFIFVEFTNPLAKQVATKYKNLGADCFAVVSGTNFEDIKSKMTNKSILVCVPELLLQTIEYFGIKKVLIDEAHKLVLDSSFRDILKDLESQLREVAESLIYMTATPEPLIGYLYFENIYSFKPIEDTTFANGFRVIYCNSIEKGLNKLGQEGKKLIRLNSHRITKKLINNKERKGFDCYFINSDERGIKYEDEETGEIIYDNTMTDYIINKSILPGGVNTLYFTTMIMDEGISIEGVEDGSLEDLECIYCICLKSDAEITRLKQFFARVRGKFKKATILVKIMKPKERPFEELNIMYKKYVEAARKAVEVYNNLASTYKDIFGQEDALVQLKNILNHKSLKFEKASINDSISIDDNFNITINYKTLYSYVYELYQNQFFFKIDELKKFVADEWEEDLYLDTTDIPNEEEEEKKEKPKKLSRSKQKTIIKNFCTNEEIPSDTQERFKLFKQLEDDLVEEITTLEKFGFSQSYVFHLIVNEKAANIEEEKKAMLLDGLKKFNFLLFKDDMIKFLNNKDFTYRIRLHKVNKLFYQISRFPKLEAILKDYLVNAINGEVALKEIFNEIEKFDEFFDKVALRQFVDNNNIYLKGVSPMKGAQEEQFFIIDNIGNYLNKDRTYLSKKKVEALKEKMDEHFGNDYNIKSLYYWIFRIFKFTKETKIKNNKEVYFYRFNGLRKTYTSNDIPDIIEL